MKARQGRQTRTAGTGPLSLRRIRTGQGSLLAWLGHQSSQTYRSTFDIGLEVRQVRLHLSAVCLASGFETGETLADVGQMPLDPFDSRGHCCAEFAQIVR